MRPKLLDRIPLIDFPLLLVTLLLISYGLWNLYSATLGGPLFYKQVYYVAAGLPLCLIIAFFTNMKILERFSYPIYWSIVILLLVVLISGHVAGGSKRWIHLGFFNLQPSELAKIGIAMVIAKFIQKDKNLFPYTLRDLLRPLLLIGMMFGLVVIQPDLGTAGIIGITAFIQILMSRLDKKSVLIALSCFILILPFGWFFGLKDYQKSRVLSFAKPSSDPKGSGYHSIQSMVAIGSGKLTGKGFQKGTQTHLLFLPERHTDFIFSVLSEEQGFVGGVAVLVLFLFFLRPGVTITFNSKDLFSFYLAMGISAIFFIHIAINIAMVLGLFPIVGVTLPFFSYGGSSMFTFLIGVGLLLNISKKVRFS